MSGRAAESPGEGRIPRRRLLGWAAASGLALTSAASCSRFAPVVPDLPDTRPQPTCVRRSALPRYDRLAGLPLVYEVNRRRSEFAIDEGFASQLEAWLDDLRRLTGWEIEQLRTYGTWTTGVDACSSWHNAGRAFDLARLRLTDGRDVSCRYDQWRQASGRRLTEARRVYWAVAASAHKHFAYVLTYLYNAQHHNHIHLDNGRSGSALSSFSSRSPSQLQAAQAILTYLWDSPVEITGRYDSATRTALSRVLARIGTDAELTDLTEDPATWAAFLDASVRRGA